MTGDLDAVRSWAAAHASTVAAGPAGIPPSAAPVPGPVELTSVTQVAARPVGTNIIAVAAEPGGGVLLAGGFASGEVRIWDLGTGQLQRTLLGHTASIRSVAWGPGLDGRRLLATGSEDSTVRIWDPDTGESLRTLSGHTGIVYAVAWAYGPDGRLLLATCSLDTTVRVWDPGTGETLRTLTGHTRHVYSLAWGFGPDGRLLLASGGLDSTVRIWDPGTGETLHVLSENTTPVRSVACGKGPDGLLLASASQDGTVRIWRQGREGLDLEVLEPGGGQAYCLAWAPLSDGRMLLAATTGSWLILWDPYSSMVLHAEEPGLQDAGIHHLGWAQAPDGRLLVVAATQSGEVHVREVTLAPPELAAAPAARDDRVARGRQETPLVLEAVDDITADFLEADPSLAPDDYSLACVMLPDGHILVAAVKASRVATANASRTVQIWDLTTGQIVGAVTDGSPFAVALGLGPDGRPLLAAPTGGGVGIWDPGTGETLQTLTGDHAGSVNSVAWGSGPDGVLLATGGSDNTALIWDPVTGRILHTLTGHTGSVNSVAWGSGPDGRLLLATGSHDNTALIWDPVTGRILHTLTGHTGIVHAVAWGNGSDGQLLLATASADDTARTWDPRTGETLRTLTGHTNGVNSVAWGNGPGGQLVLATASRDGSLRIWDPGTGTELHSISGSWGVFENAAIWAPDPQRGLLLLAAPRNDAAGATAQIWRVRLSGGVRNGPSAGEYSVKGGGSTAGVAEGALALGCRGLWVPAGLVADLVAVTGPAPGGRQLNDRRLEVLGTEPGIGRLRALGWDRQARLAFAALLAAELVIPDKYNQPGDTGPAVLRDELRAALAARSGRAIPAGISISAVRAAAAQVTDSTITLLAILGPRTCAADPLLPLRLARHVPRLPALATRRLQLITAETRTAIGAREQGIGTLLYSPGTAGISRTGPLTRLLPTQLALPRQLLTLRLAEDQLLYRQHRAPAPPAPQLVTLILDTTPPTYGPAGDTLRLAAHLIATTMWAYGRQPFLVTLTHPDRTMPLAAPADLLEVWTSATLDEPDTALPPALRTAAATGCPALLLTHHHTPAGLYAPGARTLLLTAHQPPEIPPPAPVSPYHYHLPPDPTQAQLTRAITALLTPATP